VILRGQTVGASTAGVSSESRDPPSFNGMESDITNGNLCTTFDIVVVHKALVQGHNTLLILLKVALSKMRVPP